MTTNNDQINWIQTVLRVNFGLTETLSASELETLSGLLSPRHQKNLEKKVRLIFEGLTGSLPLPIRYRLTTILKYLRNPGREIALGDFSRLAGNNLIKKLTGSKKLKYFYGDHQGVVCLSHDVDNVIGWELLPEVEKLDERYGIKSTFHVLTRADYKPDKNVLERLKNKGFEVALHGLTHDIALSFRKQEKIERTLTQGLADLGLRSAGFRSPAFSMSSELVETLDKLGFEYDASVLASTPFYPSSEFTYPFHFFNTDLVEIPLVINDDIFFRDAKLPEELIFEILGKVMESVLSVGGIFNVNIHPHNLVGKLELYEKILQFIADQKKNALVTTTAKVAELYRMQLNSLKQK